MSSKLDSTFVLTTSFDGNYTTGNIELTQFNSASQLLLKKIKIYLDMTTLSQVKVTDLIISCLSFNETFVGYIENDELFLNPQKSTKLNNL